MPLPVQRRSNDYADYYEASSKAVAEGRYTNLPKPSSFIRTSVASVVDYVRIRSSILLESSRFPHGIPMLGEQWRLMRGFVWRACKSGSDEGRKR